MFSNCNVLDWHSFSSFATMLHFFGDSENIIPRRLDAAPGFRFVYNSHCLKSKPISPGFEAPVEQYNLSGRRQAHILLQFRWIS